MYKPICEYNLVDCKILDKSINEQTKERSMRVEVKWQHAGVINNNRRRYRKEIIEREINNLAPKIANGEVTGASYHPEAYGVVDDVSHIWEKIYMDEDGQCFGNLKIIPTIRGKNVMTILEGGGKLGMSSRGFGNVTLKTEQINGVDETFDDVDEDYKLVSPGDFVISGSVGGAGIVKILEEIESRFGKKLNEIDEKRSNTLEIKNVEDLRKAYPDFIKAIEEAIVDKTMKEFEKVLDEKIKPISDENAELKKDVEEYRSAMAELVLGISERVSEYLPALDEEGEENAQRTEEEVIEIDPKELEEAEREWKRLENENAELKKKLAKMEETEEEKKKREEEEEEEKKRLAKTEETEEEKKKREEEEEEEKKRLAKTEQIKKEKTIAEEISNLEAQLKEKKIKAADLSEKGVIGNQDKLNEESQLKNDRLSYRDAILSSYKGSFKDYRKDILKR